MKRTKNIHLLVIDPQNDFMDIPGAALPVPGSSDDMRRLAALIRRIGKRLSDIHVTLDSHRVIDVAHPGMWTDGNGNLPAPFTIISAEDITTARWTPRVPSLRKRLLEYAVALEQNGNYPLMIWPEHCVIGTPGHTVQTDLLKALMEWERSEIANVDFVTKGTNAFTEHYGALMAEVPDPDDPSTGLNAGLLEVMREADEILIAGEALSHCVKSTVDQIADHIGEEHVKKFHILSDCSSPVAKVGNGPDFPAIAAAWLRDIEARGVTLVRSDEYLA
ncbi:MAG: hypothetical protein HGB34_02140 [Candidatus Moranbacteria bacterium]|nr:hypothetical protein [Candidatus Moranbacteria bacterium]